MTDKKPEPPQEKNSAQTLVEKILPAGVTDIKNVLGDTAVDKTLDEIAPVSTGSAPTASAIPKPPSGVITNGPQPAIPRTTAPIPASPDPATSPNTNGNFESTSPYSKPPIFGSRVGRMISIIIGLAFFFGMIAAIVYFLTSGRGFVLPDFLDRESAATSANATMLTNATNTPPAIETKSNTTTPDTQSAGPMDTDGDGLLDAQEEQVNTDPKKIDTDGDELTDRQEIEIYKTSPVKKDTDADGFSDGSEVRNFYNPNGNGQLLNVSEAIDSISNANINTQ
jgi:hypothetical protein